MPVSLANIGNLLISLSISLTMLFYAHEGIEREQLLGEKRSLVVMACYAALGVVGLLVAPTIRDRVLPAAGAAITFYKRVGRRSTDVKAIVAEVPDAQPSPDPKP